MKWRRESWTQLEDAVPGKWNGEDNRLQLGMNPICSGKTRRQGSWSGRARRRWQERARVASEGQGTKFRGSHQRLLHRGMRWLSLPFYKTVLAVVWWIPCRRAEVEAEGPVRSFDGGPRERRVEGQGGRKEGGISQITSASKRNVNTLVLLKHCFSCKWTFWQKAIHI